MSGHGGAVKRVEAQAAQRVVGFSAETASSSSASDSEAFKGKARSLSASALESQSHAHSNLTVKPRPLRRPSIPRAVVGTPRSVEESPKALSSSLPPSGASPLSRSPFLTADSEAVNPFAVQAAAAKSVVEGTFREMQREFQVFQHPLVTRAFKVAKSAHEGQERKNGDPVMLHVMETARVLARLGMDEKVVAAGLLHDTVDDTPMTEELLASTINDKDVVDLVRGVSKLSDMSQMHRDTIFDTHEAEKTSERWRSIVLAMCDVRIVMIKLADRLHNMQTLGALPHAKRIRFATETKTLFAPLANRLGVWGIKAELEDLCFKWLEPEEHASLSEKMEGCSSDDLIGTLETLRSALQAEGISFEDLSGRPKNLFSIYKKLKQKNMTLDEIYDKCAIRVIVDSEDLCYRALDVIHAMWSPIEGKQKDYIKNKKANGYQSLHSVVRLTEGGDPLEVQVRTSEMHYVAEHGIAAHWRYKEACSREEPDAFIERRIAWARWVLNWEGEIDDQKAHISGKDGSPKSHNYSSILPHLAEGEMDFLNMKNPWTDGAGDRAYGMMPPESSNPSSSASPVYVVLVNGYDVKVRTMPAGSTMEDLVSMEDADGSLTFTKNNSEEFSYSQALNTGDVIELVYDHPNQDPLHGHDDGDPLEFDYEIDELYYEMNNSQCVEKERARLTRLYNKMYNNQGRLEPLGV